MFTKARKSLATMNFPVAKTGFGENDVFYADHGYYFSRRGVSGTMKETFEEKLARVSGTIHRVAIDDPHRRYRDGLLYYSNKADQLDSMRLVFNPSEAANGQAQSTLS